jgi:DNA ligase-associated metallophosphoesterase
MILFPDTPQEMELLAEGAVLLRRSATLVLADLHLGKSATFRARGVPIPEGDDMRDCLRISALAKCCRAQEIIVAGDMFHAATGMSADLQEMLEVFLADLGMPFHLVIGNHDRKISRLPSAMGTAAMIDRCGMRIVHDPADVSDGGMFHLAGHWHPVVKIRDGKSTSLRMRAFVLRENLLVLPAFGSFTGGAVIRPEKGHRIFVPLRDTVVEIPKASCD